jgi:hypothetical protein
LTVKPSRPINPYRNPGTSLRNEIFGTCPEFDWHATNCAHHVPMISERDDVAHVQLELHPADR